MGEIDNPIIENETMVYADKKKGLHWLSSAKSNSQAIAAETLNTAAKIVKEFENPSLPNPQKSASAPRFSDGKDMADALEGKEKVRLRQQ